MTGYHQFCPVAKAMELFDERWTMLLVRELVMGSERFNELRRGVPHMSPTLLSKRLRELTRAGIIDRVVDGTGVRYVPTQAGRELYPVVLALGAWGVRWIGELGEEDLDPKLLLWDMHRRVDHAAVPAGQTVVEFRFRDVPAPSAHWWLVLSADDADVCDADPGYPVGITVDATLRSLVAVWRGDRTWSEALRSGDIALAGPSALLRVLPRWFTLPEYAHMPRPAETA